MEYTVTVSFSVKIQAESEKQARQIAEDIELPDNYVIDTFDIIASKQA